MEIYSPKYGDVTKFKLNVLKSKAENTANYDDKTTNGHNNGNNKNYNGHINHHNTNNNNQHNGPNIRFQEKKSAEKVTLQEKVKPEKENSFFKKAANSCIDYLVKFLEPEEVV